MKAFRSRGVLVFANSKTDWNSMPEGAQKATQLTDSNYIPKILVTTSDGSTGIEAVSYEELKADARDAARDLADKLETVENILGNEENSELPREATTESAEAATSSSPLSQSQEWTNTSGKTITAAVNRVEGEIVIFEMAGKEVPYPLANLSAESRKEIEALLQ